MRMREGIEVDGWWEEHLEPQQVWRYWVRFEEEVIELDARPCAPLRCRESTSASPEWLLERRGIDIA